MLESLPPGRVIDRYLLAGRLGRGGMATVYKAQHRHLGTWHAIKILDVSARSVHRRLLLEGRVQASLQHPNVVSVTDVVEVDGALALVLEYVNGPSLRELLQQHTLTLPQADGLARGILRGVHAAHRKGFVHRDLKPANILLQPADNGFIPKVADFGLAKLLDDARSSDDGTRTGATMGTPQYMSPEQIRDAKDVDLRSDIFAMGAILYEMVTGQRAFQGDDVVEIYNAVTQGWFTAPLDRKPNLPKRMATAIEGALALSPNDRFQDCEALAAAWEGDAASDAASTTIIPDSAWTAQAMAALTPAHPTSAASPTSLDDGPLAAPQPTFMPSEFTHGSIAEEPPTNPTVAPLTRDSSEPEPEPERRKAAWWLLGLGVFAVGATGALLGTQLRADREPVSPVVSPTVDVTPATPAVVTPVEDVPDTPALEAPAEVAAPVAPEPARTPVTRTRTERAPSVAKPNPAPAKPAPAKPAPVNTAPEQPEPDKTVPPPVEPSHAGAVTEPAAKPTPAPATDALVTVSGHPDGLWLRGDTGSFKVTGARRIEPGTYTVSMIIDGGSPVTVGAVTLRAGDRRTMRCDATALRCVW